MKKSKILLWLLCVLCVCFCVGVLSAQVSADPVEPAYMQTILNGWAPLAIDSTSGNSTPAPTDTDTVALYQYAHMVPANKTNDWEVPYFSSNGNNPVNVALPTAADGSCYWVKAIMRTNAAITPAFRINDGAWQDPSPASAALTGDGEWHEVYFELTGFSSVSSLVRFRFLALGDNCGATFYSGGTTDTYADIAGFAIFKSQADAEAYDLAAQCKIEAAAVEPVYIKTILNGYAPIAIDSTSGNSSPAIVDTDSVSLYKFARMVPANTSNIPYFSTDNNAFIYATLPNAANGSCYWVKAIMRTNAAITPAFRVNSGGWKTGSPASAALTGDEEWHEVYFELTGISTLGLDKYQIQALGTSGNAFYSGGTTSTYVDLAGFAIFKSQADAEAYDLASQCKTEVVVVEPAYIKTIANGYAPIAIDSTAGNSNPAPVDHDPVELYQYARMVPANTSNIPYFSTDNNAFIYATLPNAANGSCYWVKAIMRTNTAITPAFRVNSGGWKTGSPASAALTGDEEWHEVYFELTGISTLGLDKYQIQALGTSGNAFYSGGTTSTYVDLAGFAIFKSQADAEAYDLASCCKIENTNAVYVSATGSNSNSGRTASFPVATLSQARTLAAADAAIDTIYIIGSFTTTSAETVGVAGRTISYLGYPGSSAELDARAGRFTLAGDVYFDDLTVGFIGEDGAIKTLDYDFTLGTNLSFLNEVYCITPAYYTTVTTDPFTTPAVISIGCASVRNLYPAYIGATFNGSVTFNIQGGAQVANFLGGHGYGNSQQAVNGIIRVNASLGSQIDNFLMNANAAGGNTVFKGLRHFALDGAVTNLYLAGSANNAADAASEGVAVWMFGETATVTTFAQNGVASEDKVKHVLIFNGNDSLYNAYETASAGWTVPNAYVLNVTGGTVSAVTTNPTAAGNLACTLDGFQFWTDKTYVLIDDNEPVTVESLGGNGSTITTLGAGAHTIVFTDTLGFVNDVTSKAGYIADTSDAAEKTYAIIASVRLAESVDLSQVTAIGFYGFVTDSDTAVVTQSDAATIATLSSNGRRFYTMIYDIPTAGTEVILKPFVTVGGTTVVGSASSFVPGDIGADIYYGREAMVEAYFAD